MTTPTLAPLTPREQAVADFFHRPRVADASMGVLAAVLGLLARFAGQLYCHPVTDPPQSGAGASYCRAVAHPYSWIAYPAAALALALIVRWLWPRRHARRMALLAVSVAVIAATAWVFSLPVAVD